MDERSKTRALALAILIVVFTTGALAGTAVPKRAEAYPATTGARAVVSGDLSDLDLTPEQRGAIDAVLARQQPRIDTIVRSAVEDLRALLDSVDSEISTLLTPEQLTAYRALRDGSPGVRAVARTRTPDGEVRADTIR